jgi:rhamnosyltransferase
MEISIIIPTFQAGKLLPRLINVLHDQTLLPIEIIVIDSSSKDETLPIAHQAGCITHVIEKREFHHGKTRNYAANLAKGDTLVFLSQDALPATSSFLENLSIPLLKNLAVASSARQIAYDSANPIEAFARKYNYSSESFVRTKSDIPKMGVRAYFFSDAASMIDRETFWSIGGFSEEVIVNEDMALCAKLLYQGFTIAYQSDAIVYHSHNYNLIQLYKRYFDIGIFFWQSSDFLKQTKLGHEGLHFFLKAFSHLREDNEYKWIPRLLVDTFVRYLGFQVGFHNYLFQNAQKSNYRHWVK